MTPEPPAQRPPLVPWLSKPLEKLPPFFADTRLEARFRTYYLRHDRTNGVLSEAWAMGGSIYYRSGWLADLFAAELEGFTSQPIVAPEDRDGTELLAPGQKGYSVLGIANGRFRYKGLVLTGGRQYLDLPYVNRDDNRMTPNTFEAITLEKPEGRINFVIGLCLDHQGAKCGRVRLLRGERRCGRGQGSRLRWPAVGSERGLPPRGLHRCRSRR